MLAKGVTYVNNGINGIIGSYNKYSERVNHLAIVKKLIQHGASNLRRAHAQIPDIVIKNYMKQYIQ
jgi:hypothetical protein